jgi:hypothetical protein
MSKIFFFNGTFDQKKTVFLTLLSMFLRLKIKLKGHHFDTVEVMVADSQAVLNTLTEHNFQDAFQRQKL